MNKIQKIDIKLLVIIAFIVTTVLSASYALLNITLEKTTAAAQAGCFVVDYTGTVLSSSNLVSTTDYTNGAHATVTLNKNKDCEVYTRATIHLHVDDKNTAPLNGIQALKYKVMLGNTELSSGVVKDTSTSDSIPTDFTIDLTTVTLTTTATTYDVYVWIDSSVSLGTYNDTIFSGYIYASSEQTSTVMPINHFAETVMVSNAISDQDIDFSQSSQASNTNGIYYVESTKDDDYPIYYYRGNVNNNLLFANYCWKVVRTTETGGLKLIYNGTPSGGTCNNTGNASQISTSAFGTTTPNSPAYAGYMYGTAYTRESKSMSSDSTAYKYGQTVTYSGGTYTLGSTISNSSWSSIYNGGLNSNHYTCFTTGTTCTSVYYIYYTNSSTAYYITLTGGKTVEDALEDMLDYNTTSSTIKGDKNTEGTLDHWYYNNIQKNGYNDYIEDTVWCNDRSIGIISGWNPDGGSTREYLYFSIKNRVSSTFKPSLICSRYIDKFTVDSSNGNGNLDYPVGLLTADEVMLAGSGQYQIENSSYYLYTGNKYWSITPYDFYYSALNMTYVNNTGDLDGNDDMNMGVRPSISLANGFTLSGGNGTTASPYIIEATPKNVGPESPTRTITFYNGDTSIGTQKVSVSTETSLKSWSSLEGSVKSEYDGWKFAGWSTSSSANKVDYKNTREISITDDTNLYAVYSRKLNVNYNSNGGNGTVSSLSKTIYINSNSTTTSSQSVNLENNSFKRTGYTFSKWTVGSTTGTEYSPEAAYNPSLAYNANSYDVTIYAKWTPITYNIKYNGNGSTSGSMSNSSHTYDTNKALTSNSFTKTEYVFAGWAISSDGDVEYSDGESVKNLSSTSGATVNLYAKWVHERDLAYTINYNANGGSGTTASSTHAYDVAKNLTANGFSKTGYHFAGWSLEENGTVAYSDKQSVTNLSSTGGEAVTLYAQWAINTGLIYYYPNGGTAVSSFPLLTESYGDGSFAGASSAIHTFDYNSTSLNPNDVTVIFTRPGYHIASDATAWRVGSATSTTYLNQASQNMSSYVANENNVKLKVYANWTPSTYAIVAHPNNGTISATTGWANVSNHSTYYKNVTYDSTYGTLPTISRPGYTLTGWYTHLSKGTLSIEAASADFSQLTILTGVYPGTTYKITMDSAQVTTGSATHFSTVIYDFTTNTSLGRVDTKFGSNISYTISCPSTADPSHNIQLIIYSGIAGSTSGIATKYTKAKITTTELTTQTKYTASSTVKTPGNHMLFAGWTANTYTVNYNGNGNTGGSTTASSHTYGTAKALTANGFTKTGHTFAGWATSASGTVTYSNSQSVSNLTTTNGGTVTLYAKWNANTYTVSYNGNGNTGGSTAASSHTYGTAKALTANGFTKTGYAFAGWATSASGTVAYSNGQSVSNLTTTNGGTVTLYAKWTDNTAPTVPTYTATYASGGASYSSGTTATKRVNTKLSSTDAGSGVSYMQYSKDKSSWTKFSFSVGTLTKSGTTWSGTEVWDFNYGRNETFYFRACDVAGNCSAASTGFNIKYASQATASAKSGLKFTGASQTGVTGTNVTWSGTTSATNPGSYSATATASSGYVISEGVTTKAVSWSIAGHSFAVGASFTMSAGGSGYYGSASKACNKNTPANTFYSSSGYYAVISTFYSNVGVANTSSHSYTEANSYAIYVPKVMNSSGSSVYGAGYFRLDQVIPK